MSHKTLTQKSTIAELQLYRFQVDSETICEFVADTLNQHLELPGVIVIAGQDVGMISRQYFFEQLGQRYGVAVHLKRPIMIMLKMIETAPLQLPATTDIPTATNLALQRPRDYAYEPILVQFDQEKYRMLDIYTLQTAHSQIFVTLQTALQTAHQALEKQFKQLEEIVAERTAELSLTNNILQKTNNLLQYSEGKYRAIFEDSKDMIFITRADGQIEDVNPACETMLGYTHQEAMQRNALDVYTNPEDRKRFVKTIARQGAVNDFEIKLRHKDGQVIEGLMTATVRRNNKNKIIGYHGIIRDITLREQARRERLKLMAIQQELSIAHDIQKSLLPNPDPEWPNLDVDCFNMSAREVGGDFYKYHWFEEGSIEESGSFSLTSNRYVFAVGDISGKGVSAALLMATSLSQFDASLTLGLTPAERLAHLDKVISPYTKPRRQNCAMCYVELEVGSREVASSEVSTITKDVSPIRSAIPYFLLHIVNAGCIPPYIKRTDGSVKHPEVGGFALGQGLGFMAGYQQHTIELFSGDLIILTSDGVVEATDKSGTLLGFEQLEQIVRDGPVTSAEDMLEHLKRAVFAFTEGAEQHDDMTMVVIRV